MFTQPQPGNHSDSSSTALGEAASLAQQERRTTATRRPRKDEGVRKKFIDQEPNLSAIPITTKDDNKPSTLVQHQQATLPLPQSQRPPHSAGSTPNEHENGPASERETGSDANPCRKRTPRDTFSIFQPLRPPRKKRLDVAKVASVGQHVVSTLKTDTTKKPPVGQAKVKTITHSLTRAGHLQFVREILAISGGLDKNVMSELPFTVGGRPDAAHSDATRQSDGTADAQPSRTTTLSEPTVILPSAHRFHLASGLSLLQYSSIPIATAETIYLPQIRQLISTDLSEPYSIYVYRYFLYQWASLCFMAIDDATKEMVGVIVSKLELHRGGPLRGYIAMLATKESWRGKGIATRLVAESVDEMIRGSADEVALETEVSNTTSLKLYERLGFLRSKRLHRYYLNGNTAFRLLLYLKEGTAAKETIPPELPPLGPEEGDVQGYIPS